MAGRRDMIAGVTAFSIIGLMGGVEAHRSAPLAVDWHAMPANSSDTIARFMALEPISVLQDSQPNGGPTMLRNQTVRVLE